MERMRRTAALIVLVAAVSMTGLTGCGTAEPDVSGSWGGRLMLPDGDMADGVRDFEVAFSIDQADDRDLSGTGELAAEFDEETERETVRISGTVDDDGKLRMLFGTSPSMDGLEFDMSGRVEGDKIKGTAFVPLYDGGSEAAFELERGAKLGSDPEGDTAAMEALLRRDAAGDLEDGLDDYNEHLQGMADGVEDLEAVLAAYEEDLGAREQALADARDVLEEERENPTPEDAAFGVCGDLDGIEVYGPDGDPNNATLAIEEQLREAVSFDGITDGPREAYPEIKTAVQEEKNLALETLADVREDLGQLEEAGGTPGEEPPGTPTGEDVSLMEEEAEEGAAFLEQRLEDYDGQRDDYVAQAEAATEELRGVYQELGCI